VEGENRAGISHDAGQLCDIGFGVMENEGMEIIHSFPGFGLKHPIGEAVKLPIGGLIDFRDDWL
jgi:hypothetical protein